ncbi:MAG: nitroreductase family protein [Prevotellaceae bacterium]|jgi:nitroreductase|nr:nitroreductase family protein [Prevotellaceae bacterium]
MEKKKIITYQLICIALMVVVLVLALQTPDKNEKTESKTISNQEVVLSVIHNRKSVRNFIPQKKVSKENLTTLVKAGMAAPTAVNKQPWAFVAITERTTLDSLAEGLPYAKMLKEAGAAIIVCGDLTKAIEEYPEYWVQDCSAATENILLAVEVMGLGAVWTAVYPDKDRVEFVKNILDLPETAIPLNVIPIGHPSGETMPKDKWKEENLHWENW